MSFAVDAAAYGRFMGRYSEKLAAQFLDLVPPERGHRALDVGCGPGALTQLLADRLGIGSVSAVDPSRSFVDAVGVRLPGLDVRKASGELLPFDEGTFDLVAAQLVVHFMADPQAGIGEMARVACSGGSVAACVWDHAGEHGPLSVFWRAARDLDPAVRGEADLPGVRDGHLVELFQSAGLADARQTVLAVRATFADVESWWEPFTLGVGPAGSYLAALDQAHREQLRRRCTQLLPDVQFTVEARAWAAVATKSN